MVFESQSELRSEERGKRKERGERGGREGTEDWRRKERKNRKDGPAKGAASRPEGEGILRPVLGSHLPSPGPCQSTEHLLKIL